MRLQPGARGLLEGRSAMQSEVSDFLRYCRLERRLADLTCSAYERDVTACMRFLLAEGFSDWRAVRSSSSRTASWNCDRALRGGARPRPHGGSRPACRTSLKSSRYRYR